MERRGSKEVDLFWRLVKGWVPIQEEGGGSEVSPTTTVVLTGEGTWSRTDVHRKGGRGRFRDHDTGVGKPSRRYSQVPHLWTGERGDTVAQKGTHSVHTQKGDRVRLSSRPCPGGHSAVRNVTHPRVFCKQLLYLFTTTYFQHPISVLPSSLICSSCTSESCRTLFCVLA